MQKVLLTFFLFGVLNFAISQNQIQNQKYIKALSELRSHIIEKDKINLAELHLFYTFLDSIQCPEVLEIIYPSDSELKISKAKPNLAVFSCLSTLLERYPYINEIDSILAYNNVLMELVKFGVLEPKYPFKIKKNVAFLEELSFYNIKQTDQIAEIGAGEGIFSAVVHTIINPKVLYVNEIDSTNMQVCKENIQQFNIKDTIGIRFSFGSDTDTNIPASNLDKIILRRTYHHFSNYKSMLKSIRNNLNDDGALYIMESIKKICPEAISKSKIIKQLTKNGFQLNNEATVNDYYILKFVKSHS